MLDVADLTVFEGEILAVVGPSGAGKSTLMRLLALLEAPSKGTITLQNQRLWQNGDPPLDLRREVTMVFQQPHLLRRTVHQNIRYGLDVRGVMDEAHIAALEESLGLASLRYAAAHTLSGGEKQRVALARALAIRPKILLLDEPTANLDPYNIKLIETIIRESNAAGVTIVIVTHNIFQARRLAHRVGLLIEGNLVELAETNQFFDQPINPKTTAFLRGDLIY